MKYIPWNILSCEIWYPEVNSIPKNIVYLIVIYNMYYIIILYTQYIGSRDINKIILFKY